MVDYSSEPKPRFPGLRRLLRWGIRAAIVLACIGLAVQIGLWTWAAVEGRGLNARVDALRKAGHPTKPAELSTPAVPDAENAAIELRAAAAAIDRDARDWQRLARATAVELPLGDKQRAAIQQVLKDSGDALALVEDAAAKPKVDWALVFKSPMLLPDMPDLNEQRGLATLLRYAALAALEEGDHRAALRYADQALFVSEAMEYQPTLVGHLVAAGIGALSCKIVGDAAPELRVGPSERDASPEQVRALIAALLDDSDVNAGLSRALDGERVMGMDACIALAEGRMNNAQAKRVVPSGVHNLSGFMFRNASGVSDHIDGLTAAVQATSDWPSFQQRMAAAPTAPQRSPRLYMVASIFAASLDRAVLAHHRHVAQRRLAAASLALAWYRHDHAGRLPATLAELVPAYLPFVPADPLAAGGKPIGYVAKSDQYRVYSVGEDGVDDGGKPENPNAFGRTARGTDLVVDLIRQPRPPEAEEPELEEPAEVDRVR